MATAPRYGRHVAAALVPSLAAAALVAGAFAVRAPLWERAGGSSATTASTELPPVVIELAAAADVVPGEHPREELFAPSWPLLPVPDVTAVVGKVALPPAPPRETPPLAGVVVTRMVAPRLRIDHGIEALGLNAAGGLDSPHDGSYRVGWYPEYGTPGGGGNAVLSAHESWNHLQGPFYFMYDAASGDEITLELADGRRLQYVVQSNVRYDVRQLPMAELLWPSRRPAGQEWLTFITCGGRIVYDATGFGEYLDRDVVVARRVG